MRAVALTEKTYARHEAGHMGARAPLRGATVAGSAAGLTSSTPLFAAWPPVQDQDNTVPFGVTAQSAAVHGMTNSRTIPTRSPGDNARVAPQRLRHSLMRRS